MAHVAPNLDHFLQAIADPTRRRILLALKEKGGCSIKTESGGKESGLCAGDIEQRVKLAQPTVSHHMRILEEATREGHWRWYRRDEKLITEMMRRLKEQL
jgi:DNA-binding transcriptional ArsR family regulator